MRISDWSSDVCSSDLYQHLYDHERLLATKRSVGPVTVSSLVAFSGLVLSAWAASGTLGYDLGWLLGFFLASILATMRSEERRVGKVCVRTCRSRWSP